MAAAAGMVALSAATGGPLVAVAGTAALACAVGLVNGLLVAKGKVVPFVVTLGMYTILGSVTPCWYTMASRSTTPPTGCVA